MPVCSLHHWAGALVQEAHPDNIWFWGCQILAQALWALNYQPPVPQTLNHQHQKLLHLVVQQPWTQLAPPLIWSLNPRPWQNKWCIDRMQTRLAFIQKSEDSTFPVKSLSILLNFFLMVLQDTWSTPLTAKLLVHANGTRVLAWPNCFSVIWIVQEMIPWYRDHSRILKAWKSSGEGIAYLLSLNQGGCVKSVCVCKQLKQGWGDGEMENVLFGMR